MHSAAVLACQPRLRGGTQSCRTGHRSLRPERDSRRDQAVWSVSGGFRRIGLRRLGRVTRLAPIGEKESTTMSPPPSTTAAIGTGGLVRRAVVAASITVDQDATEVANGTVARFHGSSASGMTVNTRSPGLFRNQPPVNPASKMGERLDGSDARQARATPAPRTTAPGRTFIAAPPHRSSRAKALRGNGYFANRHERPSRHAGESPSPRWQTRGPQVGSPCRYAGTASGRNTSRRSYGQHHDR